MNMDFFNLFWPIILIVNLYLLGGIECIYNGDIVDGLYDYKFVVAIKAKMKGGQFGCTGSIIGDDLILTAAHCVVDKDDGNNFAGQVKIIAHTLNMNSKLGTIERRAKTIYVLQDYLKDRYDDVAIIQVNKKYKPADFRVKLQKIPLAQSLPNKKVDLIAAGYGDFEFKNGEPRSDGRLRTLRVQIAPHSLCGNVKGGFKLLYFCLKGEDGFTGNDQGIAVGDSGGPVAIKKAKGNFELIGVLSEKLVRQGGANDMSAPEIVMSVPYYFTNEAAYRFIQKVRDGDVIDPNEILAYEMPNTVSCF